MKVRDVVKFKGGYPGRGRPRFGGPHGVRQRYDERRAGLREGSALLLTGLCNPQVIRTAEMMDMRCVVFVRGKEVDPAILQLARSRDIMVLKTEYRMFTACVLLFSGGLRGESGTE